MGLNPKSEARSFFNISSPPENCLYYPCLTDAGNFTLVGSIANLIVAQRAKAHGIEISFWRYFVIGAPLTVLTIAIDTCGSENTLAITSTHQ